MEFVYRKNTLMSTLLLLLICILKSTNTFSLTYISAHDFLFLWRIYVVRRWPWGGFCNWWWRAVCIFVNNIKSRKGEYWHISRYQSLENRLNFASLYVGYNICYTGLWLHWNRHTLYISIRIISFVDNNFIVGNVFLILLESPTFFIPHAILTRVFCDVEITIRLSQDVAWWIVLLFRFVDSDWPYCTYKVSILIRTMR